jgi:hypothetical protein
VLKRNGTQHDGWYCNGARRIKDHSCLDEILEQCHNENDLMEYLKKANFREQKDSMDLAVLSEDFCFIWLNNDGTISYVERMMPYPSFER